jgi:hypothetical protein
LVNLTILAQKILLIRIFKSHKSESKKCSLGELWIVHNFSSHEKNNYIALRCT